MVFMDLDLLLVCQPGLLTDPPVAHTVRAASARLFEVALGLVLAAATPLAVRPGTRRGESEQDAAPSLAGSPGGNL
jgi:hypothetical protein